MIGFQGRDIRIWPGIRINVCERNGAASAQLECSDKQGRKLWLRNEANDEEKNRNSLQVDGYDDLFNDIARSDCNLACCQ